MKTNTGKFLPVLAAAALGFALSAKAQVGAGSSGQAEPAFGSIGSNYAEADFGYLKHDGPPEALRDYGFTYNQASLTQGAWGLDTDLRYDYLAGSADGFYDRRQTVEAGPTAYLIQGWGKPFLSGDAGYAWQRAADVGRKSFAYTLTGGVEFQVLRPLAVTPFVAYDAEPHLYDHELPDSNFYDREWDYGVKAEYRFTPHWGVTAGIQMDDHSRNDLGYRVGAGFHY